MADKQPLIKLNPIPDETTNALMKPAADTVGSAARDVLSAGFNLILTPLRKYNIRKDKELKDFADKINNETAKIPEENRDSSKVGLILKAVDDSKYRLNDDIMRQAFAKLIARGLDNRTNQSFYPSYSETLSNMSTTEAQFLLKLHENFGSNVAIIAPSIKSTDNSSSRVAKPWYLLWDTGFQYDDTYAISMDLLAKSGMIEVRHDAWLTHKHFADQYSEFEKSPFFSVRKVVLQPGQDETVSIEKGLIRFTDLGESFIQFIL
ncbi:DUF4393 domain-containing protein [Schleiferilactobacillus perolens]|uniref:DUF4393 domain-containing protein n=1 Tax=Schleiferilactobacillus perolens TaxID=100468 RepID=UPI0039E74E4D